MRFRIWFKLWLRYFYKVISIGYRRRKSAKQLERERQKRRERKSGRYSIDKARSERIKAGLRRRNSSYQALGYALALFAVSCVMIALLPFSLADWGSKSARRQRSIRRRSEKTGMLQKGEKYDKAQPVSRKNASFDCKTGQKPAARVNKTEKDRIESFKRASNSQGKVYDGEYSHKEAYATPSFIKNDPKESEYIADYPPRAPHDIRINKRLMAVSDHQGRALGVGEYFDIKIDGGSVALEYRGETFAAVLKEDAIPLEVTLRLKRRIYGVVLAISYDGERVVYECDALIDAKS